MDEVPEPTVSGPLDVIVRIGGAGVCRTDLHIMEGQWDAAMGTPLPYILGHENAGWVHEVGSAVTNVPGGAPAPPPPPPPPRPSRGRPRGGGRPPPPRAPPPPPPRR